MREHSNGSAYDVHILSQQSGETMASWQCATVPISSSKKVKDWFIDKSALTRPASCNECERPWSWPRNIAYANVPNCVPCDIRPTTSECILAHLTCAPSQGPGEPMQPTFCKALFEQLDLTWDKPSCGFKCRGSLVQEFEYDKVTGNIFYDISAQESESNGYARLITLNAWWMDLAMVLMKVSASVLTLQSEIILVATLFINEETDGGTNDLKWPFSLVWLTTLLIQCFLTFRTASREWNIKASPRVGDIITNCCFWDRTCAFVSCWMFHFFNVDGHVKDIVTILHPWKSVQPYAAFKQEGHRAFLIGYLDEFLFRVDNFSGRHNSLPLQLLTRSVMVAFKILLLVTSDMSTRTAETILRLAMLFSLPTILLGIYDTWQLHMDRHYLKQKLHAILAVDYSTQGADTLVEIESISTAGTTESTAIRTELLIRQQEAAAKLLQLHFGASVNLARGTIRSPQVLDECGKCGRVPHKYENQPEEPPDEVCFRSGDYVQLCSNYAQYNDAVRGPLSTDDLAVVLTVGPYIERNGRRLLVCSLLSRKPWWYDRGALEKVEAPTPEDSFHLQNLQALDENTSDGERDVCQERVPIPIIPCCSTTMGI